MRPALILAAASTLAACSGGEGGNHTADSNLSSAGAEAEAPAGGRATSGAVTVGEATLRLPAIPGRPGAAYFTFRNDGAALTLASVSAERAERAEMHESVMTDGVMQMRQIENVPLPQGSTIFAPGGKHIMLFGLDPALKAGDAVPLTLTFENGPPITVEAVAQAVGGSNGHGTH